MDTKVTEGSLWYVISMAWIRKWRTYVYFDHLMGQPSESTSDEERVHPGPIDNSDILESVSDELYLLEDHHSHKWMNALLKKGLSEGKDYMVVDEFTWEFFKNRFRAKGEIIRKGIRVSKETKDCIVELYLKQLLVYPIPNIETLKISQPLIALVSRTDSLKSLESKMVRLLNKRSSDNQGSYFCTSANLWKLADNDLDPLKDIEGKIKKKFTKI